MGTEMRHRRSWSFHLEFGRAGRTRRAPDCSRRMIPSLMEYGKYRLAPHRAARRTQSGDDSMMNAAAFSVA